MEWLSRSHWPWFFPEFLFIARVNMSKHAGSKDVLDRVCHYTFKRNTTVKYFRIFHIPCNVFDDNKPNLLVSKTTHASLNINYMWLHIFLEGKLRFCGIKSFMLCILLFLPRPFDEFQFDVPNCSKKRDLMEESWAWATQARVRSPPYGPGSPIRLIDFLSSPSTSGMHHIQRIMTNVPAKDQQSSNWKWWSTVEDQRLGKKWVT